MPKKLTSKQRLYGSVALTHLRQMSRGLRRWKLGAAAGLTQFGVNLTRIPPGLDGPASLAHCRI
jgi:uncharacterized cupin superfamily protein